MTEADVTEVAGSSGAEGLEHAGDAAVLALVATGDQQALEVCYDRFASRVYSLARRICGNEHAAEDVAQEVFLTVWATAGRFDPTRASAATWLMTLAHHRAVDAVRRDSSALRRRTRALSEDGWELPAAPGADGAAVDAVMASAVRAGLATLNPTYRRVLVLAYYGGFTQAEIAAILAIPVGTVKSRTFTATAHLRAHLSSLEFRA